MYILNFVWYNIKKEAIYMIKREIYLNKIIPFIDIDLIKVITGIRRCGKTVLLSQIQEF